MALLIGAMTLGLILSLLALGVLISFRIFAFPDITVDGSFTLGAAVAATMLVAGVHPLLATGAAFLSGLAAGALTGVLHTKFKINGLLAGILVMTALYSINLRIMGKSNVPLLTDTTTLSTLAEQAATWVRGSDEDMTVFGWDIKVREGAMLALSLGAVVGIGAIVYGFFRSDLGTAMRATGDNPQMIRALGVSVDRMIILGLALSNGLVALSGSLLAQQFGFADVQMGIGMVVWGLASVILGESLVGTGHLGLTIVGVAMGSVLFRLLVAIALLWKLDPNDLKLITAVFVFAALVLPGMLSNVKKRSWRIAHSRASRRDEDVQRGYAVRGPRAPGSEPGGRGRLVRCRDRRQRVGQIDHAQRGGGLVLPGRRPHHAGQS